jgi:hypothetical protein
MSRVPALRHVKNPIRFGNCGSASKIGNSSRLRWYRSRASVWCVAPLEMNAGACWGKNTIALRGRGVERPRKVTLPLPLHQMVLYIRSKQSYKYHASNPAVEHNTWNSCVWDKQSQINTVSVLLLWLMDAPDARQTGYCSHLIWNVTSVGIIEINASSRLAPQVNL